MKRILLLVPLILLVISCASQQFLNKARDRYESGEVVYAAELAIRSLQENPKNQKAILFLEDVFPRAILALEERIEESLAGNDKFRWSIAADAYGKIHQLNDAVSSLPELYLKKEKRTVTFQLTYYPEEYAEAKQMAAEENYREALALSGSKDRTVLRQAVSYFKKALSYVPGYKDAEKLMEEAGKSATDIVVILPRETSDESAVEKSTAGAADSKLYVNTREYIEEALISALIRGAKQKSFLKVIDKNFRDAALEGQKNILSGAFDESNFLEIGQLYDANKIVTFTLFPIDIDEPAITKRSENRAVERVLEETDEEYELYPDHKINYSGNVTYYRESAFISLTASYKLVNVETTEIIDSNTFTVKEEDSVEWIEVEGDIEILSEDELVLYREMNRIVKSPAQLVDDAKRELVNKLSAAILLHFE